MLFRSCGLFIPAEENSRIALCNQLYVDIGDEQYIEQSLSTFSAHMKNIVHIVDKVDEHSLVLLDELGSGTDPIEGAALARAVLQHLQDKNARAVVTTHQGELKTYAYQHPRAENASVEFDPVTLKPTYKLNIGIPGQSNASNRPTRTTTPHTPPQEGGGADPPRPLRSPGPTHPPPVPILLQLLF